jgi:phosphoribosylamine-glycine ligase
VRKDLKEQFINSDDYKNKLREAHDTAVTIYQTGLKLGITIGVGVSGRYSTTYMYKDEDIKEVENKLMSPIIDKYIEDNYDYKGIPHEDQLVTDLIFESLTSEGIEDLMNKFIEKYL